MLKTKILVVLAVIILVLTLFYLSPFSEVEPRTVCQSVEKVQDNPAGADLAPVCEQVLYSTSILYQQPIFPFKEKITKDIQFCLDNRRLVEDKCNASIDVAGLNPESYHGSIYCEYIVLDGSGWMVDYVEITRNTDEYIKSDIGLEYNLSKISVSGLHAKNSSFNKNCEKEIEKVLITD